MKRRRFWKILLLVVALGVVLGFLFRTELKRWGYEGWGRDGWQQPERVLLALAVQPGQRVADIGSGGGYFTFRFARAVGPEGRVYAADIDAGMNDYVARRAAALGLANVEVILAATDDPRLPADGVDLIFICNTYHHLQDRVAYFRGLRRYLRPGGRVAIVDFRRDSNFLIRWSGHFTDAAELRRELEGAGYTVVADHDFLSRQHFLVLTPAEAPAEASAAPGL
jgi:ubiquinone/menaquinone biosynthesis C-methylase UbiE